MPSRIPSKRGCFLLIVLLLVMTAAGVYVMTDDDHKAILTSVGTMMTHSLWSHNVTSLTDPTSLTPEMKMTTSQSKPTTSKSKKATHKPTTHKSKTTSNFTVPTCNVNAYVDYYRKHHGFPRSLHWVTDHEYQADFCHFKQVTTRRIHNCLEKKKIHSVRMIGDSQSRFWRTALEHMFTRAGVKCTEIAKETATTKDRRKYFLRNNPTSKINFTLTPTHPGCIMRSILQICKFKSVVTGAAVKLELEYISHCLPSVNDPFMNFLMTDYWKDSFPELLLWFPPLNHIIRKLSFIEGVKTLRSYFAGFKKYRKNSTRILVVPSAAEIESKRHQKKRYQGLLATEAIDRLNSELYKLMESDLLAPDVSRVYGFHSLIDFTKAEDKRSPDGVHWVEPFYDIIIPPIISTFCESPDA